jgi:hypothetical protein
MKRNNSIAALVIGIVATFGVGVPAAAADQPTPDILQTPDAYLASHAADAVDAPSVGMTPDAYLASHVTDAVDAPSVLTTPDAYLAGLGKDLAESSPGAELTGAAASPPAPDSGGFDWSDALVGALFGVALMLVALAARRSVGRHRQAPAASTT